MKRKLVSATLALLTTIFSAAIQVQAAEAIKVDIFKGETASVNSYIFSNGESLIVMDVQRSTDEAKKLGKLIKAKRLPLTHILISHGHPDHYIGMNWLLKAFPQAKVVVANKDIKQDIIGFSTWMESVGWLDAEPGLKPQSAKNPDGFDYENKIEALTDSNLTFTGGGELKLNTHYQPAEANHVTTVFVDDLNGFFTSDLGYNKVHLWMGQGVTDQHIENWKQQLAEFSTRYKDRKPVIYPGHGDPTDISLFTNMLTYMEHFQQVTKQVKSKEQAIAEMTKRYPDYKEADFLLKYSVDYHVNH